MSEATLSPLEKLLGGTLVPGLVNLALIGAIAWFGAVLTWQFVPAPETAVVQTQSAARTSAAPAPTRDLGAEISRYHLFGAPGSKPAAAAPVATTDAPDTKLNLSLRGVMAYDPQAAALAIISAASGEEKVYGVGDELPGAATLEEVLEDRVILKRNGRLETLRLPEDSTPVALSGSAADRGSDPISESSLSDLSPRDIRDRIVRNPMDFARKVRTIPHREDGKLIGYKVRAREYQDLLQQYGLQPDDVVIEVNGTPLNDPKESLRTLRSLATATTIEAKILRDGVEMPLFVSLE